jgi:hypothetical protein
MKELSPYIKECMIGTTSYRISDQLRDIHCTPYASVVGMLLHTNGKFIVRKDIKDCVGDLKFKYDTNVLYIFWLINL